MREKPPMPSSLRGAVTGLALVLLTSACRHGASLSPERVDAIHRECRQRLDDGRMRLHRSKWVGFVAQRENAPADGPVVIYGASWCGACRFAAEYLKERHIPFIERDVEADSTANEAAKATLAEAGLDAKGGLPVVDIRGTVMIGFNACVVEAAWSGGASH
jgi:glutaredoxin